MRAVAFGMLDVLVGALLGRQLPAFRTGAPSLSGCLLYWA